MKINTIIKIYGKTYSKIIKKELEKEFENKKENKKENKLKNIYNEYINIMKNAKDIGTNNNLLSSYTLAAFFIAMNRKTGLDVETNYKILKYGMEKSKMLKVFLGNSKNYFSEKKMEYRRKWSKETHEKKYKNDWVVDVIEGNDDFVFGLDYTECGVCKLCNDEGCLELAKYLCKLDYMLVELIGIKLERTKTIAEGYKLCDFRFKNK